MFDNVWHALKVTFANEVGRISRANNVDSRDVMDVFKKDIKLNISDKYLTPGFAFGGSCLPKDVRALNYLARQSDVTVPVIDSIIRSNLEQIQAGIRLILGGNSKNIGVIGFAFKTGTDDLRESPIVDVIEFLLGKGYDLRIFDSSVNISFLRGANRNYLDNKIPHIAEMMTDSVDGVLQHAQTIVIGNAAREIDQVPADVWATKVIVDLAGCVGPEVRTQAMTYLAPGWT